MDGSNRRASVVAALLPGGESAAVMHEVAHGQKYSWPVSTTRTSEPP